jgi:hypothetical protein
MLRTVHRARARAGPHTHPQPEENTPTRRLQLQPPGPSKAEPPARAHSSAHAEHTCMSGQTEAPQSATSGPVGLPPNPNPYALCSGGPSL